MSVLPQPYSGQACQLAMKGPQPLSGHFLNEYSCMSFLTSLASDCAFSGAKAESSQARCRAE